MNDSALKEAIQRLLAQGDAVGDRNLKQLADSKKAPKPEPEVCPKCGAPMAEGDDPSMPDKCSKCGYEKSDADDNNSDSDMAALMEQGSQEG